MPTRPRSGFLFATHPMPEMRHTTDAPQSDQVPLVVSLDGALLRTDPRLETLWGAFRKRPAAALGALLRGRAGLPERLHTIAPPDLEHLPARASVLRLIREALERGQKIVLVSAADQRLVDDQAALLGLTGDHFGSDGRRTLVGQARADVLTATFGRGGFDYLGNTSSDLPVWRAARGVLAVAPGKHVAAQLAALGKAAAPFDPTWAFASLLREMRPTQWLKNLLLLLPVLLEHDLSVARLAPVALAIIAFCTMTSSVYLVNDMLDLEADRRHPEKRARPIASGALPISVAMAAAPALIVLSLLLGSVVGTKFLAVQLAYLSMATVYSVWLKHLAWLDLFLLASLYVLRVLAGAEAAGLRAQVWPLAFCFAVFLALSVVKRLTELARVKNKGHLAGRAYKAENIDRLVALALAASLAAVGLFLAYTMSAHTKALYANPGLFRFAAIPIGVWLVRMVRSAQTGEEDYDPLAFVTHDGLGLAIAGGGILLVLLAI